MFSDYDLHMRQYHSRSGDITWSTVYTHVNELCMLNRITALKYLLRPVNNNSRYFTVLCLPPFLYFTTRNDLRWLKTKSDPR